MVGFGRRDEVIMDTPVHGKRTGIMRLTPRGGPLFPR
ncbi:MAG: hypothetical protein WC340_15480 [Kiritimatiellia bacterium]